VFRLEITWTQRTARANRTKQEHRLYINRCMLASRGGLMVRWRLWSVCKFVLAIC